MASDIFTGTANPIGGNWTTCVGSQAMRKNGAAGGATADQNAAYYNAVSFANDQYSQAVILGYGGGAYDAPGLVLRHNGTNFYYVWLNYNGTRVYISHYNGGGWTNIGSYATISAFTVGHTLRAEIEGNTITVKDNTTSIRTQDVSSVGITSGSAGISQYGNSDYRIDDWEGGDLGAAGITGTFSQTLDALVSSSAGVAPIVGTLSQTFDALACSGGSSSAVVGALSKTLDDLTSVSAGVSTIIGSLSKTLDSISVSSVISTILIDALSGTDAGFSGTPDNTDPFTSGQQVSYTVQSPLAVGSYYWRVRAIDPGGSNVFGAWTAGRIFEIINAATGQLASTLGDVTAVSAGAVSVSGSASAVLGDVGLSSAARASVSGQLGSTLGDVVSTSAGSVATMGALSSTLDDCALSSAIAQGDVAQGSLAVTLGDVSVSSAGVVPVLGSASVTLDAATSSSSGLQPIAGACAVTLADITAAAAVRVLIQGIFAASLNDCTLASYGCEVLPMPPTSRMTSARAGNRITQSKAENRIR